MDKEIGIVEIWYNEQGKAIQGHFEPTAKVYDDSCMDKLMNGTNGISSEDKIKNDSEALLSEWFNNISDIELADRDQYKISSSLLNCIAWPNGNVQYCRISFYLQKIN